MHRIDSQGHVDNRFSNGNPQIGQRATKVSAEWLNDVQENIAHVVEMAQLDLQKGNSELLYLAIVQLAAGAVGGDEAPEGSVPTTRQVNTNGLLTGGGTLANDLDLSVPAASPEDIRTGHLDNKAITPEGLNLAAGAVYLTNGYIRLPGGLIVQWGAAASAGNSTTVVTLPTTFPNACLFAGVSGGTVDGGAQDNNPHVSGRGNGSISIFSARDSTTYINFLAIGF